MTKPNGPARDRKRVTVFDTNPFNPYGAEVSRAIAEAGHSVTRFCRRGVEFSSGGVTERPILPRHANGRRSLPQLLRTAAALVAFFATVAVERPIAVFPWPSAPVDMVAVRGAQWLGLRTVLVAHNPIPSRDEVQLGSTAQRARSGADVVVVHRTGYEGHLSSVRRLAVIPHPLYIAWERHTRGNAVVDPRIPQKSVAFVGGTRPDKGFLHLPAIARLLRPSGTLLVTAIGVGKPEEVEAIRNEENVLLIGDGARLLDDSEIRSVFESCAAIIAPYVDVTASGTLLMARTLGVPIVAFQSDPVSEIADSRFLVGPGDLEGLAKAAEEIQSEGYEWPQSTESLDQKCVLEWGRLLNELS